MTIAILPPPPGETANPAPVRSANSLRRTSSIDVSFPNGWEGDRLFHGRARDYLTCVSGKPGKVCAEASMEVALTTADRMITAISANPAPAGLQKLVGQRGGSHLRLFVREAMPDLLEGGAPLYLLLDDISGTSLVSTWGLSHWDPDWLERAAASVPAQQRRQLEDRAGVCWGLKPGNSGLDISQARGSVGRADAGELRNPLDPEGWHDFPVIEGASFRRARRIDVVRDEAAGLIHIDSAFQDSSPRMDGHRAAIHEYRLRATADFATHKLLTLSPEPRILPFPECPGAVGNAQRLIGARLEDIRDAVLAELRGPEGCTHLNDALRALAEVPKLTPYLDTLQPA
ncbi:MAG TPA: DUF2889 domain-containing protein [Novosphingobium sp.]